LGTPPFGVSCLPSCEAALMPATHCRHLTNPQKF